MGDEHVSSVVDTVENTIELVENSTPENKVDEPNGASDTNSTEKNKGNGSSSKANLRSQLRRMNTVASANPHEFQELSTEMLDNERKKMNAALQQRDPHFNPKQYQLTEARQVREVPEPEKVLLTKEQLYIDDKPNYKILREHLVREGRLSPEAVLQLVQEATEILRDEPTLLELEAPFTVCGDIHGQFYDLINLLDNAGDPATTPYLFLGDYVDRGSFSCEVIFLLLCMKVNNPESVYLIRGNHESRAMTNIHNFKVECLRKYSTPIYDKIMECFDCLPLAALLNRLRAIFADLARQNPVTLQPGAYLVGCQAGATGLTHEELREHVSRALIRINRVVAR